MNTRQLKYLSFLGVVIISLTGCNPSAQEEDRENIETTASVLEAESTISEETVVDNSEYEEITTDIDTSDWPIYRNEEYGFEVKYPPELEWKTIGHDGDGVGIKLIEEGKAVNDESHPLIGLWIYPGREYSLEERIARNQDQLDRGLLRAEAERVKFNNLRAVRFEGKMNGAASTTFIENTTVYNFITNNEFLRDTSETGIYNAVLTTFKLID